MVFLIGFLGLIVVWMIAFGSRIADLNRLSDEFDESQLTISALTATTGALATEIVRAGSDAAVAEFGRHPRRTCVVFYFNSRAGKLVPDLVGAVFFH